MYRLLIKYNGDYQDLTLTGEGGLILETNDPLNYEFGKANKTYSIIIPNIGMNNLLLENIFNKAFDYRVRFSDVYLVLENNLYLSGVLAINEISQESVRAQFINANFDLIEALKNTDLTEYDLNLSHVVTAANQVSSEALTLHSGDVVYDLIDRGKTQYHANSLESNPDLYANRVLVSERYPAVRVKKIMDTLFAGYTIGGNHFTNALFGEKQYLLFSRPNSYISGNADDWDRNRHNLERRPSADTYNRYDTSLASSINQQIFQSSQIDVTITNDKAMNTPGMRDVRIRTNGVYNIQYMISGMSGGDELPPTTGGKTTVVITKNGTVIKKEEYPLPSFPNNYGDEPFEFYISTGNIYLEDEDIIDCTATITATIPVPADQTSYYIRILKSKTFLKAFIDTGIGQGMTLDVSDVLPRMKAAEFLSAYLMEFNLQLYINAEKKQVIFFKQQGATVNEIDITSKIIAGSIRIMPDSERPNYLFRRAISDAKIRELQSTQNINREYLYNLNGRETEIFQSEFSTTHEQAIPKWGFTEISPQILTSFDRLNPTIQPNWGTDAGLRLVYDAGVKDCSYKHEQTSTNVAPTRTTYRKLSPVISGFDSNFDGDLFNDYHLENIRSKVYGHILECDMILNDEFIKDLYYLNDAKDWRNIFTINVSGFSGRYKFINLKRKKDNVYSVKLYKII